MLKWLEQKPAPTQNQFDILALKHTYKTDHLDQGCLIQFYEISYAAGFLSNRVDNMFHLKLVTLVTAVVYLVTPSRQLATPLA